MELLSWSSFKTASDAGPSVSCHRYQPERRTLIAGLADGHLAYWTRRKDCGSQGSSDAKPYLLHAHAGGVRCVLLVESVAQLCVFYWRHQIGRKEAPGRVMLFGGIDGVKFRDAVLPGQRVVLAVKAVDVRVRRSRYDAMAFVDGRIVFSGQITGLLGPEMPEIYPDRV